MDTREGNNGYIFVLKFGIIPSLIGPYVVSSENLIKDQL
jgi:hypothetical protein